MTIRTTLAIVALAATVAVPFSAAQADSKLKGLYDTPHVTGYPYEIDGKNVFEINRELRAERKRQEAAAQTGTSGQGIVATPRKRNWFQRHFKPVTLKTS